MPDGGSRGPDHALRLSVSPEGAPVHDPLRLPAVQQRLFGRRRARGQAHDLQEVRDEVPHPRSGCGIPALLRRSFGAPGSAGARAIASARSVRAGTAAAAARSPRRVESVPEVRREDVGAARRCRLRPPVPLLPDHVPRRSGHRTGPDIGRTTAAGTRTGRRRDRPVPEVPGGVDRGPGGRGRRSRVPFLPDGLPRRKAEAQAEHPTGAPERSPPVPARTEGQEEGR